MRRHREYHFNYVEWSVDDTGQMAKGEIPVAVVALDQPKAEAKADAEYREYVHHGQRLNWARLTRHLVRVTEPRSVEGELVA